MLKKHEQEKAKRYHDTYKAEQELHKLMKNIISAADYGEEDEDYTKTVHLKLGSRTLSYDPYYQKLIYYDSDDCEYEIEEDNLETVQNLIKEIKNRFAAFKSKIEEIRTKAAKEVFGKPIDDILGYKE